MVKRRTHFPVVSLSCIAIPCVLRVQYLQSVPNGQRGGEYADHDHCCFQVKERAAEIDLSFSRTPSPPSVNEVFAMAFSACNPKFFISSLESVLEQLVWMRIAATIQLFPV